MKPLEGAFINATTVRLRTGHIITGVERHDTAYCTGWLAGSLYVSRDDGKTWSASALTFRCG